LVGAPLLVVELEVFHRDKVQLPEEMTNGSPVVAAEDFMQSQKSVVIRYEQCTYIYTHETAGAI
jgi:hypothetical protein